MPNVLQGTRSILKYSKWFAALLVNTKLHFLSILELHIRNCVFQVLKQTKPSVEVIITAKSKIRHPVGIKTVDHSDALGASPAGAAKTISSFSTYHLNSMDWAKSTAKRTEKLLSFVIWCDLYYRFDSSLSLLQKQSVTKCVVIIWYNINTLRLRQNCRHFTKLLPFQTHFL